MVLYCGGACSSACTNTLLKEGKERTANVVTKAAGVGRSDSACDIAPSTACTRHPFLCLLVRRATDSVAGCGNGNPLMWHLHPHPEPDIPGRCWLETPLHTSSSFRTSSTARASCGAEGTPSAAWRSCSRRRSCTTPGLPPCLGTALLPRRLTQNPVLCLPRPCVYAESMPPTVAAICRGV